MSRGEAMETPIRVALAMLNIDSDIRKEALDYAISHLAKGTISVFDVSSLID